MQSVTGATSHPRHETLYLSPDHRFLFERLLHTSFDPVLEAKHNAAEVISRLEADSGASRGPSSARVTIAEFSDFQYPHCRRFALLLDQLSPVEQENVRFVFYHFPLSFHSWARRAAEAAACAQMQDGAAFWDVQTQVFEHQQEMTPENLRSLMLSFAAHSKRLDMEKIQELF